MGVQLRNVRCMRCGEWGHQSGDRECALKDFNPHGTNYTVNLCQALCVCGVD